MNDSTNLIFFFSKNNKKEITNTFFFLLDLLSCLLLVLHLSNNHVQWNCLLNNKKKEEEKGKEVETHKQYKFEPFHLITTSVDSVPPTRPATIFSADVKSDLPENKTTSHSLAKKYLNARTKVEQGETVKHALKPGGPICKSL